MVIEMYEKETEKLIGLLDATASGELQIQDTIIEIKMLVKEISATNIGTVNGLAEQYDISPNSIKTALRAGNIEGEKSGKFWLVSIESFKKHFKLGGK